MTIHGFFILNALHDGKTGPKPDGEDSEDEQNESKHVEAETLAIRAPDDEIAVGGTAKNLDFDFEKKPSEPRKLNRISNSKMNRISTQFNDMNLPNISNLPVYEEMRFRQYMKDRAAGKQADQHRNQNTFYDTSLPPAGDFESHFQQIPIEKLLDEERLRYANDEDEINEAMAQSELIQNVMAPELVENLAVNAGNSVNLNVVQSALRNSNYNNNVGLESGARGGVNFDNINSAGNIASGHLLSAGKIKPNIPKDAQSFNKQIKAAMDLHEEENRRNGIEKSG